ncbi:ribonuclease-like 3 [Oryzias latipes]
MKILLSCLLILMLVDDSSLATFETFRRQNIRDPIGENECEEMIRGREINVRTCKEAHPFIVSTEIELRDICKGKGNLDMITSTRKFTIVRCVLNRGAKYPDCKYQGSVLTNRPLVVKCENNLPIHFYDDTNVTGF